MKKDITAFKALLKADYERHIKWFSKIVDSKKTVLIGDSIIAYFPLKANNLDSNVINLGIPGDTTIGTLNRLDDLIRLNPKIIIIHIGTNDLVLTDDNLETIYDRIIEIKKTISNHLVNSMIFTVSILPVLENHEMTNKNYLLWRNNKQIVSLNNMLKNNLDSKYYIDVHPLLLNDKQELNPNYTYDGVHLNKEGYDILIKKIKDTLKAHGETL